VPSPPLHPLLGKVPLSGREGLFVGLSLLLLLCYFLPWTLTGTSLWGLWGASTSRLLLARGLFVCLLLLPLTTRYPRIRSYSTLGTTFLVNLVFLQSVSAFTSPGYGAQLALVLSVALLFLGADSQLVRATDFTMGKINSRGAEVFSHWGVALPDVGFSAQEFYGRIETDIRSRNWPGVEFLRLGYSEAGLLSHTREYLRVVRHRQVVDICSSTFGRDYFFTMREGEIQSQISPATLLAFVLITFSVFAWFISVLGSLSGVIWFAFIAFLTSIIIINVGRLGLTRLDSLLLRTPVIGPIYETLFRRSHTYFQHDSRVVFLKLMDEIVKVHVDQETATKGIQLLSCFEHQPILDGLYTRTVRQTAQGNSK
jgi:hypothetical protein